MHLCATTLVFSQAHPGMLSPNSVWKHRLPFQKETGLRSEDSRIHSGVWNELEDCLSGSGCVRIPISLPLTNTESRQFNHLVVSTRLQKVKPMQHIGAADICKKSKEQSHETKPCDPTLYRKTISSSGSNSGNFVPVELLTVGHRQPE